MNGSALPTDIKNIISGRNYWVDRHQVALRKARETLLELPMTEMLDNHDMEAAIMKYLSISGSVLVPREPTDEMVAATSEIVTHTYGGDYNGYMDADVAKTAWCCMIDAALDDAMKKFVEACGKWRAIETAPKDGTAVLCYSSMTGPYNSSWDKHLETFPCGYWGVTGEWFPVATHWMPLPEPPKP